jgi:hypothetical protein
VPLSTNAVVQRAHNEQANRRFIAVYTSGLTGTAGREVRLRAPSTTEDALRIAITVEQAEIQERRSNSFYLDSELDISLSGRVKEPETGHVNTGTPSAQRTPSHPPNQRIPSHQRGARKTQSDAPAKCYECGGYGHFARDCGNRRLRAPVSKAGGNGGAKTKGRVQPPQRGNKGVVRRPHQPAEN